MNTKTLLAGTAIALFAGVPAGAWAAAPAAQDTAPAEQAADEKAPTDIDIVVTGTRIVRDGYTSPTPVTVATVEDLSKTTPSSIPDALNKLPQFQNSLSLGFWPAAARASKYRPRSSNFVGS